MSGELALLALLVAGYALIAARLERFSVGPALAFVLIGLVVSEEILGPISLQPGTEPVKVLAETTLTLLLFADASAIRAHQLRHDGGAIGRLLIIGLLLTIVLGTLSALAVFPSISIGLAMLIGASLAPTDAALGQPVVTNPSVPARIRRVLNVESGLNDGIATPFVFFALALATSEGAGGGASWLTDALSEVVVGVLAGTCVGLAGGWLLQFADRRHWTSAQSRQLLVLALAGSSYLASVALGGNGFIAAFVGGLAFAAGSRDREESAVRFTETQGSLLAIGVWLSFGLLLAGELSALWDIRAVIYAVLSLTLIRMVPVAIALLGARFQPLTVLFVGWFGPRGLASIVFLIIGLESLETAGIDPGPFVAAAAWTVLFSVILHGLTAGPFAARYGRRMRSLPADAPEHEGDPPPSAARLSWAGEATR